jgi:hypothetical protein
VQAVSWGGIGYQLGLLALWSSKKSLALPLVL